jgi:hypothetical protein
MPNVTRIERTPEDAALLVELDALVIRTNAQRERWGEQVAAVDERRGVPPRKHVAAPVQPPPEPPRCTPEQHVWLRIPASFQCACGEFEVIDSWTKTN